MRRPILVARIALFAALVYVFSWGTSFLPNINLVFFIVFSAGFLWGALPGAAVGAVGMGLWSTFNPYGPALLPITVAQIVGAAASGFVGAAFRRSAWERSGPLGRASRLVVSALVCTVAFYIVVNTVDALLFQPFWPRFIGGAIWSLISLVSNVIIFPLLFGATRYLYARESAFQ